MLLMFTLHQIHSISTSLKPSSSKSMSSPSSEEKLSVLCSGVAGPIMFLDDLFRRSSRPCLPREVYFWRPARGDMPKVS